MANDGCMPRMPRVEYAGAIYHITVRMAGHAWDTGCGVNPSVCLFRDDAERVWFIDQLYSSEPGADSGGPRAADGKEVATVARLPMEQLL